MPIKSSHKVGLSLIVLYLVAWLDRMAINMTMPFMAKDLGIGPERIGWILSAFFLGYALMQVPGGFLADRYGPRRVILGSLTWWSVFTAATGMAGGLGSMLATRVLFGLGEGVFPAAVWKVLSQWFTRKNRATANALVISSIALGPALTPLLLAPVIEAYGWRACFYGLGLLGAVCVPLAWRTISNSLLEDPRVSAAEKARFAAESASAAATAEAGLAPAGFRALLREPTVWVLFAIGLIFNVTMYGWLSWLPSYLLVKKGLSLKGMAWAASLPFLFGAVGCMCAGWVSDRWFRGRRRFLVFFCMVAGAACLHFFTRVEDRTGYMALQCGAGLLLFMACGAAWSLPMILLPTHLMGTGSGLINTGGQIGGILANLLIGHYIGMRGGDYGAGFEIMLGAALLAAALVLIGVRERPVGAATVPAGIIAAGNGLPQKA